MWFYTQNIKTAELMYVRFNKTKGQSWSYCSWIYNYLCNQCLSPLKLWVQTPFMERCTWYNIMW